MADNQTMPFDSTATNYQVEVDLEDLVWQFRVHWNATDEAWYMDILGTDNDVDVKNIPLVGGVNILGPFAIRELGLMYVVDNESGFQDPDRDGLGDRYQVLYVIKENVDAFLSA